MHPDRLKTTLEKYETGKPQAKMAYTDFGLKIHLHTQQTCEKNEQMHKKTGMREWMTKGKNTLIPKDPHYGTTTKIY